MTITVGPILRDEVSAPFFDGAARGQFLIRRSRATGAALAPHACTCPATGGVDLNWEPVSGGARVVSWTSLTRKLPDGGEARGVFVIAELDEGPWWWSQVVDAEPEAMHEGRRLRIEFQRHGEYEAVPVFRLA